MYASLFGGGLTGRLTVGPFEIGTFDHPRQPDGSVIPVLATDLHIEPPELVRDGAPVKTDAGAWHGGGINDEVAALVSLALRSRCRAGGRLWTHGIGSDALGDEPFAMDLSEPTSTLHPRDLEMLPGVVGTRDLAQAEEFLRGFATLAPEDAVRVVRAARQYQLAVWVANDDPNLAWLELVGAVETAAGATSLPDQSHVERIAELQPDLARELADVDPAKAETIAKTVSNLVGSTRKFAAFLDAYGPPPPTARPADYDQVDWDALPRALRMIYGYRSRALHEGTPFPAPMCEFPRAYESGVPVEKAGGLSTATQNASWSAREYPMLLATFEYVVQGALTAWWADLISTAAGTGPVEA